MSKFSALNVTTIFLVFIGQLFSAPPATYTSDNVTALSPSELPILNSPVGEGSTKVNKSNSDEFLNIERALVAKPSANSMNPLSQVHPSMPLQALVTEQRRLINILDALAPQDPHREPYIKSINALGAHIFSWPKGQGQTMGTVVVRPGDWLERIASSAEVSLGRFTTFNKNLIPDRIAVGMRLHYPIGELKVIVKKSQFELWLFFNDHLFHIYPVGLGAQGRDTPIVKTRVSTSRAKRPTYTDRETGITYPYGHPDNPVGTRWIGLTMGQGYGIHGTQEEESIGKALSKGCVRMHKRDLEEVYDLLLPGDKVWIVE